VPKLIPPLQMNETQVHSSSRRLLVYQREYLVFERTFPDFEGLQDWLAINTLLSHQAIDLLCEKGQIIFGEGIYEESLQLDHKPSSHLTH
jgi:hypothetical protein